MQNVLLVLSTFPDASEARQIGTLLIEKQLAACVNLLPAVESIYRWQGNVEKAGETLAFFKTTRDAFGEFSRVLTELHPYDVPEIIALTPAEISGPYLQWWLAQVKE